MKERPILYNAPMVRALLNGSKTQTRRIVKPHRGPVSLERAMAGYCSYGLPGDRLWVRETFDAILPQDPTYNGGAPIAYDYAATYEHGYRLGDSLGIKKRWTPSIHMPREACRILLEIVSVRVEQLKHISEADARAEGVTIDDSHMNGYCAGEFLPPSVRAFRDLWQSINGADSWEANPLVWAIEFKRVQP